MEASELDEGMMVLDSCLARINWRLKPSSKRRLQLDILALATKMRPVVMIDYGGIMPQLRQHLSSLIQLARKESLVFEHLHVMVIQDMIYLVHVTELAQHVRSSFGSTQQPLLFVDLQHESPKMITRIEESQLAMQLVSIQRLFLTIFSPEGVADPSPSDDAGGATCRSFASRSDECIDLSNCMDNTDVTVPTLNGWLLGYPVVYLFGKEHISDAIYNLSTKYLHIFQVFVCRTMSVLAKAERREKDKLDKKRGGDITRIMVLCEESDRNSTLKKGTQAEELLSFSVPYDLSMRASNEQWAAAFLAQMQAKWERCANAWKSLKMEVSECHPQAIVL
ncbi:hypothetical protein Fmac_019799 [Flemingia macrophylla]|uniref:Uncharacterized protein n=1 Tax=Flemingia macrophylla TaxID=520843 RepID=A0ABD1M8W4_9FABA